ncbi:MAG: hypothetical protein ACQETO_05320, partial [Pseudomonadota bacterium]
ASQKLVDAAGLLASQPESLQLRYLQTLTEIASEQNSTIVFPLPMNLIEGLQKVLGHNATGAGQSGPAAGSEKE